MAALQVTLLGDRSQPFAFPDEVGYLAAAALVAGADVVPFLGPSALYHAGYPLLLAPLRLAVDDPETLYRGAVLVNVALTAALGALLFATARRLLGLDRLRAALAAGAAAAYPGVVLGAGAAWAESLFQASFAGHVLLAARVAARPGIGSAAAFGASAAWLYAVHPRALPALVVAAALLVLLVAARRLGPAAGGAGLAVAAAGLAGVLLLHAVIRERIYSPHDATSAGRVIELLGDPSGWGVFLTAVSGQAWYLTAGTLGLAPLGAGALGLAAWRGRAGAARRGPTDARAAASGLAVASAAGVLLLSALFQSYAETALRGSADRLVFGRYVDGVAPVLLLAGLATLLRLPRRRLALAAGLGATLAVALAAGLAIGAGPDGLRGPTRPVVLLGVSVLDRDPDGLPVLWITAGAVAAMLVVALCAAAARRAAVLLLGAAFALAAVDVEERLMEPFVSSRTVFVGLDGAGPALPDRPALLFDLATPGGYIGYWGLQHRLGTSAMTAFSSAFGVVPPGGLVVAPRPWPLGQLLGARMVFPDPETAQTLWAMPGPEQARLAAAGMLLPADPAAPLAPAARAAEVQPAGGRSLTVAPGGSAELPVRVRHAGGGQPWPGARVAGDAGAVRVEAVWRGADDPAGTPVALAAGRLPRTVMPGQTVTVDLVLRAATLGGAPLPRGRYEVSLRAVQSAAGTLAAPPAAPVSVLVRG